uniref:Uncharacterized protein n=1 Tax=uncultured marine Nitrospinaceae bacterium TaxID=482920 RepID=A4GIX7_9BACT|nr:hypothetical protein [uncultured marine Nitrospinaceae bacterium]
MGLAWPAFTRKTPAISVELTAPIPGNNTPSFPFDDSIFFAKPLYLVSLIKPYLPQIG